MAKAASAVRWMRLSRMIENVALADIEAAKRRIIDDLIHKRRGVRYVEVVEGELVPGLVGSIRGQQHVDLPEDFLRFGRIDWQWSMATLDGVTVGDIEVTVLLAGPASNATEPIGPKTWLTDAARRRKPGETVTDFARRIEPEMARAQKAGECCSAWQCRTIVNNMRLLRLS